MCLGVHTHTHQAAPQIHEDSCHVNYLTATACVLKYKIAQNSLSNQGSFLAATYPQTLFPSPHTEHFDPVMDEHGPSSLRDNPGPFQDSCRITQAWVGRAHTRVV